MTYVELMHVIRKYMIRKVHFCGQFSPFHFLSFQVGTSASLGTKQYFYIPKYQDLRLATTKYSISKMAFITQNVGKIFHLSKVVHSFSSSSVKSHSALIPQTYRSTSKFIHMSSISNSNPTPRVNQISSIHPLMKTAIATKSKMSTRKLSSTGIFDRMRGAFSQKTDKKKEEQTAEQLRKMAEYEGMCLNEYKLLSCVVWSILKLFYTYLFVSRLILW